MEARKTSDKVRELGRAEPNRLCFECTAKNPTYVNLFNHTFVCEKCAGLLRTYSHRVKSVSQAIFSPDEVAQLAAQGNQAAHAVWMARWDPARDQVPPASDSAKMAEYLRQKYIDKRWCASATAAAPPAVRVASSPAIAPSASESPQPPMGGQPAPPLGALKPLAAAPAPPTLSSAGARQAVTSATPAVPTFPATSTPSPTAAPLRSAPVDLFAPLPNETASEKWVGFDAVAAPVAAPAPAGGAAAQPAWTPQPMAQPAWTPQPAAQPAWTPQPAAQPAWTPQPMAQPAWTPQPAAQAALNSQQPAWTPQPAAQSALTSQPALQPAWTPQPTAPPQWTSPPQPGWASQTQPPAASASQPQSWASNTAQATQPVQPWSAAAPQQPWSSAAPAPAQQPWSSVAPAQPAWPSAGLTTPQWTPAPATTPFTAPAGSGNPSQPWAAAALNQPAPAWSAGGVAAPTPGQPWATASGPSAGPYANGPAAWGPPQQQQQQQQQLGRMAQGAWPGQPLSGALATPAQWAPQAAAISSGAGAATWNPATPLPQAAFAPVVSTSTSGPPASAGWGTAVTGTAASSTATTGAAGWSNGTAPALAAPAATAAPAAMGWSSTTSPARVSTAPVAPATNGLGWSTGVAPAVAAASGSDGPSSDSAAPEAAEPPRPPEPAYVPPAQLSKVMQHILQRTEKLEGHRNAVRDQERSFPDEATINDWSVADRTKMLRRLEQLVGEHAEELMRVLLQLDAVETETDDDRRFRKARVHEIQEAIHAADALLKRIRLTCTRWGVTPRVAAH